MADRRRQALSQHLAERGGFWEEDISGNLQKSETNWEAIEPEPASTIAIRHLIRWRLSQTDGATGGVGGRRPCGPTRPGLTCADSIPRGHIMNTPLKSSPISGRMADPTGADIVGTTLAAAGATHAFGIPGGEVLALIEGLDRAGLRFVLVKHENGGGFMAEGLWHTTGSLPVLVATLGPGVANAVNVVANAMQDRVPLIFLTGCVDAAEAETYTHQVFDHQAMLRPIVKGSFRLAPGAVGAGIAKAVALATTGQPGPVHVDVPIGVAEGAATEAPVPIFTRADPGLPAASVLQLARDALARSVRPLRLQASMP